MAPPKTAGCRHSQGPAGTGGADEESSRRQLPRSAARGSRVVHGLGGLGVRRPGWVNNKQCKPA